MSARSVAIAAAFAPPFGLAVYAAASHVTLLAGWALSSALLPLAFLLGCGVAFVGAARWSGTVPSVGGRYGRTILVVTSVFLALAFATASYGAVATADREWDGLVAWSLKARYLAPPADLSHPFFTDPAVLAHSRTYPLLQPLCLGACQALVGELPGRMFFPFVYLAFVALVGGVAAARRMPAAHGGLMMLAFAATPMWFARGSGAVDSGYAELLLGYCVAVAAAGLVLRWPALLLAGAFCLPLVKPEGLPYGLLLMLVTLLAGDRRLHWAATGAVGGASLVWFLLRPRLSGHLAEDPTAVVAGVLAIMAVSLVLLELRLRLAFRRRVWVGVTATGVVVAMMLAVACRETLAASGVPVLRDFLGNLPDLPRRLADAPTILLGYLQGFLFVRKFGLIFPMFLMLLCVRRAWSGTEPHRSATAFFLGGLGMACVAILLAEGSDWEHEFKSRFDRLLLQWVGVGWLVLGPWMSVLVSGGPPPDRRSMRSATGGTSPQQG